MTNKIETNVQFWTNYWGVLWHDSEGSTVLYGFENESLDHINKAQAVIANKGGCFGYVAKGSAIVQDGQISWHLVAGQWFSLPNGFMLNLTENSRVVVSQTLSYHGIYAMGGPVETQGRLRYIDGCSDTLLCSPPLLGDPCLNHLHFPNNIQQTPHTHPSLRAGIIAKGQGVCVANKQTIPLSTGTVFYIAKDAEHCFITGTESLDVIAYHPDSDWGPTHEDHPMVNRTWVDGLKIDNQALHHQAVIVIGRSQAR